MLLFSPRFRLSIFCLILFSTAAAAQNLKPLAARIRDLQLAGKDFVSYSLFSNSEFKKKGPLTELERETQFLRLDYEQLHQLVGQRPECLVLDLPWKGGILRLQLYEAPVLADGFTVQTSAGDPFVYTPGAYYRGIVENEPGSVAAVSFFEGEVIGVIAHPLWGNLNLGRLERPGNQLDYVLFSENAVPERPEFNCAERLPDGWEDPKDLPPSFDVNGCVQIFFECDYELFQNKGSVGNTVNYVTGFFNVVATLYTNETISVAISQMYVWTSPDVYSTGSSGDVLDEFMAFRTNFDGELAHLVGLGGGGLGGIAYLDVLCDNTFNYAYSNISSNYNGYPMYSWTIEVVTHETGHNLASHHTHWCGWTGGAIDNCYTPEGSCSQGPAPTNGGTIMSYCHLTSYGINFANGFGPQPGDAIRNGVSSAACLLSTCPSNTCPAPTNLTVTGITNTTATIGWNTVAGATSYNLQYRVVSTATWTTITGASNPYTLTGLAPVTKYEVQVQAVCGGTASPYRVGLIFSTAASACPEPSNLVASNPTSTSVTINWTENGTATQWQLEYGLLGFVQGSGTTVTVSSKPYTINGLAPSTFYDCYVRATCGGAAGNSTWVGPLTFNTLLENDNPSGAIELFVDQPCPGTNVYSNVGASTTAGEFSPSVSNGGYWDTGANNTVWFKFAAPSSGAVKITTDISPLGSLSDTQIALYNTDNPTSATNHLLVSNEDGGAQGNGWATLAYYCGLTPGSTYYVQVDGWNTQTGSFCIEVQETFAIPNPGTTCTTYTQSSVNGNTAPNKWFNVFHKPNSYDIGQPVIAVKSSANLSTVTVREIRNSSVQSAPNGVKYMQRYYNITSSQNAAGPKLVRLFYTDTELDNLKTATNNPTYTAEDLNISHYDGVNEDCTPNNNTTANGTSLITNVTAVDIGSSGIFYLELQSPGFSEFAGIFGQTVLPVELIYFSGQAEPGRNRLQWATASEKDVAFFALERSPDGLAPWKEAGRIGPQAGAAFPKTYFLEDRAPLERSYYRLNMTDLDGSYRYSDVVLLEQQVPDGLRQIYPNPVAETLFAEYQASTERSVVFRIFGPDGQLMLEQPVDLENGLNILPFSIAHLPPGLYYFNVAGEKGRSFVRQ